MSQFARPNADIASLQWATSSNEYAKIDEVAPSDSDLTESTSGPNAGHLEVALSAVIDPAVGTGHVIHVRLSRTGVFNFDAPVELRNASGVLATLSINANTSTPTTFTYTLTAGEANAIPTGDYAGGLRLRFRKLETEDGAGQLQIYWAQFEVPDAGYAHLDVDLTNGGLKVVAAASGFYLIRDATNGGYKRVAGVEVAGSGALVLNASKEIVIS